MNKAVHIIGYAICFSLIAFMCVHECVYMFMHPELTKTQIVIWLFMEHWKTMLIAFAAYIVGSIGKENP